jgi:hypothetical protein
MRELFQGKRVRGADRAAQNDRARRRMIEIEAGLRNFVEKKK